MKKVTIILSMALMAVTQVFAQTPVTVCEQTIKIGGTGEENMFFGFAAGDQINFEFESDKELKEIQIFELIEKNASQKYSNFKATSAKTSIYVPEKAVYQFRFKNGAVGGRICKVKIQRVPESEATQRFNTTPRIKTLYDTTYTHYTEDSLVGYDTLRFWDPIKVLAENYVKVETPNENSPYAAHAQSIVSNYSPYAKIPIDIQSYNYKTEYETHQVISWAFWFSTGPNPKVSVAKELTSEAAAMYAQSQIPIPVLSDVAGDVAKFAAGYAVNIMIPNTGDDINYALLKASDEGKFYDGTYGAYSLISNRAKGCFQRYSSPKYCNTNYVLCFKNTNTIYQIPISFSCAVTIEVKKYKDDVVERIELKKRTVPVNRTRMNVTKTQVYVPAE